jgi:NAD(P) transhydrogenase subunit alpha
MIIGVLKEPSPETRISLTPETVSALKKKGYSILVETNAGNDAFCSNEQFTASGADITDRSKVYNLQIYYYPSMHRRMKFSREGRIMIELFHH